jgi:hypothetical protein
MGIAAHSRKSRLRCRLDSEPAATYAFSMLNGLAWLDVDYRTLFCLENGGRIERENDPDLSPGPRFWLGGCVEGNIAGIRADVPDDIAEKLQDLMATEPPFVHPALPVHMEAYLSALAGDAAAEHNFGIIYELPHGLSDESDARLIAGDTDEGQDLLRSWAAHGIPGGLLDLGFRDVADFWPPWCAVAVGDEIASMAFAARLSDIGAELGLVTAMTFRGRGLAAAAVAGWTRLTALQSRTLFYSTDRRNTASQAVAAKLGLSIKGATLRIA